MIQLQIKNKSNFINNFLSPIGKLTENTVLKVGKEKISAISSSSDGTLIVHCTYNQTNDVQDTISLNNNYRNHHAVLV